MKLIERREDHDLYQLDEGEVSVCIFMDGTVQFKVISSGAEVELTRIEILDFVTGFYKYLSENLLKLLSEAEKQ